MDYSESSKKVLSKNYNNRSLATQSQRLSLIRIQLKISLFSQCLGHSKIFSVQAKLETEFGESKYLESVTESESQNAGCLAISYPFSSKHT